MLFKSDETDGKIILTIFLCYTSNVKSSKDFFKVEITQTVKTYVISSMMKKKILSIGV